jgi:hypothetical protein
MQFMWELLHLVSVYTCAKYCGNQKILAEQMDVCTSVGLIVFFYTIWVSIMRISHFSDTNRFAVFLFFYTIWVRIPCKKLHT